MLKAAGVSDMVIVAMIRSGRQTVAVPRRRPLETTPPPAPEPEAPPVVVLDRPEPIVREVARSSFLSRCRCSSRRHRSDRARTTAAINEPTIEAGRTSRAFTTEYLGIRRKAAAGCIPSAERL